MDVNIYLSIGLGPVVVVLTGEGSHPSHGASRVEGAQFQVAELKGRSLATAKGNARKALDDDHFSLTRNRDGLKSDGQGSGRLVVNQDLILLDLDLISTIGEDDGLLAGLIKVNDDGEILIEEIASQDVLAANVVNFVSLLVKGDDAIRANDRSMAYKIIVKI
jgi:hypothetical protein